MTRRSTRRSLRCSRIIHAIEGVKIQGHDFNGMDEARWKNLDEMLYTDARLELGKV